MCTDLLIIVVSIISFGQLLFSFLSSLIHQSHITSHWAARGSQSNVIDIRLAARSIKFNWLLLFDWFSIDRINRRIIHFPNFFVIDSITFDCIRLLFDCIRFMKILHPPFCIFLLLLFFLAWTKKKHLNFFPIF